LDPVSTQLLRDLILEEHRRGATILFSTHVMPQAEDICQHVIMVHQGRKVLDERLSDIRSQYNPRIVEFDPLDPNADISAIARLRGVERIDRDDGGYKVLLVDNADPAEIMHEIIHCTTPARLELSRPRLEDIFIRLVSSSADSAEDRKQLRANLAHADAKEASL